MDRSGHRVANNRIPVYSETMVDCITHIRVIDAVVQFVYRPVLVRKPVFGSKSINQPGSEPEQDSSFQLEKSHCSVHHLRQPLT